MNILKYIGKTLIIRTQPATIFALLTMAGLALFSFVALLYILGYILWFGLEIISWDFWYILVYVATTIWSSYATRYWYRQLKELRNARTNRVREE